MTGDGIECRNMGFESLLVSWYFHLPLVPWFGVSLGTPHCSGELIVIMAGVKTPTRVTVRERSTNAPNRGKRVFPGSSVHDNNRRNMSVLLTPNRTSR